VFNKTTKKEKEGCAAPFVKGRGEGIRLEPKKESLSSPFSEKKEGIKKGLPPDFLPIRRERGKIRFAKKGGCFFIIQWWRKWKGGRFLFPSFPTKRT